MLTKLVLPSCERNPTHPNHPPQLQKPLRIQAMGLSKHIDSLFDDGAKIPQEAVQTPGVDSPGAEFDATGLQFAKMVFNLLYGRDPTPDVAADFVPQHQHSTFPKVEEHEPGDAPVDGYCLTFDHFVDSADDDPETLMLNLCDPADPHSATYFELDLAPYATGLAAPVVLLVPRWCQLRKGTTDCQRINDEVKEAKEGFRPPIK